MLEAIILAGGLGKRLRPMVSALPKVLAPVNEKPFISFILDHLLENGIQKCVLCTGYMHNKIEEIFGSMYRSMHIEYSIEYTQLGTGGAIAQVLKKAYSNMFLILNGDTLFKIDIDKLINEHRKNDSDVTIALRHVENAERYGRIILNGSQITGFMEKGVAGPGEINGGIYVIEKKMCEHFPAASSFSFEKDFLEKNINTLNCNGVVSDSYFIDIGIPDDYIRATQELPIT